MEQYGPVFVKRNQNSQLYAAQMLCSCIPYIKVNTWERDSFRREFFFKGNSIIEMAKHTLNDITTYHIWKYRCKVLYEGANAIIPTIIIANNIWLEFTSTLWARLNHIKAKANW
jgi:hypothetical protein